MTFYTGPVAFAVLFPFALIGEFNVFVESAQSKPLSTFGFLLGRRGRLQLTLAAHSRRRV